MSFTNGELAFDFIADGSNPDGEDTAYVSVTTNNPNIWQYDFIILINEGKIVVLFVPVGIAPGGTADIVLKKKEADGTLSSFPPDQSFNLGLIKGKDYGTINYLYRGTWPDTTDNVEFSIEPFKFTSRANLTNTPVQTAITVSTYLDSGERIWGGAVINIGEDTQVDTFYVKADFEKETLVAGDTVRVLEKKVDKFGNEGSFPAGTLFEASVMEGCPAGELMKGNSKGVYLNNLTEPFYFVVSDSLTAADTLVTIKVGVPQEDGVTYLSYDDFYGKTNGGLSLSIVSNGVASIIPKPAKVTSACSTYEITLPSDRASARLFELEIIYPKANSPVETITDEPKMPTVTCKAQLKNYNKGAVAFVWEYWVSNSFRRFDTDENNTELCQRVAKTGITGISFANNSEITEWVVPFKKDSLIEFTVVAPLPKRVKNEGYNGNCYEVIDSWDYSEDVFTGGYVWIKVTAYDKNWVRIAEAKLNANKILGIDKKENVTNPSITAVVTEAAQNEIKAILYIESKTTHFVEILKSYNKTKGLPAYGIPNGFGLMQLDNPAPTELQLWNWRANLKGGSDLFFGEKRTMAVNNLKTHESSAEEKLMEQFSLYNGDKYWFWSVDNKTGEKYWKRYPLNSFNKWGVKDEKPYAERVMEKYKELIGE